MRLPLCKNARFALYFNSKRKPSFLTKNPNTSLFAYPLLR